MLLDLLKERYGKYSFARFTGFLIVIFYLLWASYILISKGEIVDVPNNIMILVIALYGANKIRETLTWVFGKY